MTKRNTAVVFDKRKFLLPKMEATEHGFFVRELSGRALLEFQEAAQKLGGDTDLSEAMSIMALLVVRGTCDANGKPVFEDDDVQLLADKSPVLLKDIAVEVLKISGVPAGILVGIDEVTDSLKNDQPTSSTSA